MKKLTLAVLILMLLTKPSFEQQPPKQILLKGLDGKTIDIAKSEQNGNQLILLVFWKTDRPDCCSNLESLQSAWTGKLRSQGVRMIAICEDCTGSTAHVKPIVMAKEWEFEVYIDVNGDFKRKMGVNKLPYSILFDRNFNKLCATEGYCPGNEDEVCRKVLSFLRSDGQP